MISALLTGAFYLFGWAIVTVSLAWLSAAIYPYVAHRLSSIGSIRAAFFTFVISLLAPATAAVSLLLLSFPTWVHRVIAPHCHGDLCAPHSLHFAVESTLSSVTLSLTAAGVIVVGLTMVSQMLTSRRHQRMLERLSDIESSGYMRFENQHRIAWCFGLLRPRVFLSSGMIESLSNEQRQIVLARELVHAAQRDNFRIWLVKWSTVVWPKNIRQQIRKDFSRNCDSICDLRAYRVVCESISVDTFIDTLKDAYDFQPTGDPNVEFASWQTRLETLRAEHAAQTQASVSPRLNTFIFSTATFCVWVALVVASVSVGHPLLENLSS